MKIELINLFKEYLKGWSWDEWQAAGSSDKEDVVANAIADIGPEIDVDEAYDIFYDWVAGLTEADFESNLAEAITPEEKARVAAENKARLARLAAFETEHKANSRERLKQRAIQTAKDAIAQGVIDKYNKYWRKSILSNDIYPAIDPETQELVFDIAEKKRIFAPTNQQVKN